MRLLGVSLVELVLQESSFMAFVSGFVDQIGDREVVEVENLVGFEGLGVHENGDRLDVVKKGGRDLPLVFRGEDGELCRGGVFLFLFAG